jgi:DNA topoisomerase-6 subunit A
MAAKKKAPAVTPAKKNERKQPLTAIDKVTVREIRACATAVHDAIVRQEKPELKFPERSLRNASYDKKGGFKMGRARVERTLTVNTVKTFAQTLKLMSLSKELVETDDFATKREAYYVSKNWGEARFDEQPESDAVMDDIEALFSLEGVIRENLRFKADEHGGKVSGNLVVVDRDRDTQAEQRIDCTKFGSGAYAIPTSVEHLGFQTDAKFVLAIETIGMFERLHQHNWWRKAKCVLIGTQGVPTRATRRFIRKLSDDCKIPVFAFNDCDPYAFSNIYRTLKVGSGNAVHLNQFFCVPQARYLGVTPQDIVDYELPTHPLKDIDIKRARDMLKNDPFFQAHKEWQKAIEQMLKSGQRAEQQALAKHGLNFVMEEYLPEKLKAAGQFLP